MAAWQKNGYLCVYDTLTDAGYFTRNKKVTRFRQRHDHDAAVYI